MDSDGFSMQIKNDKLKLIENRVSEKKDCLSRTVDCQSSFCAKDSYRSKRRTVKRLPTYFIALSARFET